MKEIIQKIHQSPFKIFYIYSGGGSKAASDILAVEGASQTLLESYCPYSRESLNSFINKIPEKYCSLETTLNLASAGFIKALKTNKSIKRKNLISVSVTASIKTSTTKKGEHKFFIVVQTYNSTKHIKCIFDKDKYSRDEEEEILSNYVICEIAKSCGIKVNPYIEVKNIFKNEVKPKKSVIKLFNNKIDFFSNNKSVTELIFPGSFNPLHSGHIKMKELAEKKTGLKASYEISIKNADKPPLTFYEIQKITDQFSKNENWILTRSAKFSDKSYIFKNSIFVIGVDTLERIFKVKFYKSEEDMNSKISRMLENNVNFLVFGRNINGSFISLDDLVIPNALKDRCTGFSEDIFREDISSTEIRLNDD